jgi:hypothetical protein
MLHSARFLRAALAFGATFALAGSASALDVTLQIFENGASLATLDQTSLGCTGQGATANCQGTGLTKGDLSLDSWNMHFDNEPVISGTTVMTNMSTSASQQFTLIFTLPVAPIGPSTLMGGSVQGGMTDNTGGPPPTAPPYATVSAPTGSALYTARIDGSGVQTLYPDPASFSVGMPFQSGNIPNTAFGTPIPNMPGPAVTTNIGIMLDFILTPGDSASFTSNFVVVVPEPATAALFGMGLAGLAIAGRRRD